MFDTIKSWWQTPFQQPMDVVSVFLAVGLILVALLLWSRILAALQEG